MRANLIRTGILLSLAIISVLPSVVSAQTRRAVRIPLDDGGLSMLGLTRAVLTEYGYSGEHLHFPDVRVNIKGLKGQIRLKGLLHGARRGERQPVFERVKGWVVAARTAK